MARRIQQISKSVLRVEQGSLYPALHRMELDGLIESVLGHDGEQSQGEVLPPDAARRRELTSETERWNAIAGAIATILQEG